MVFVASSLARWARAAEACFTFVLTVSPSSTSRRMASDNVGLSGCFSAHLIMEARITGLARNPINGVVRGCSVMFCFARVVFFMVEV